MADYHPAPLAAARTENLSIAMKPSLDLPSGRIASRNAPPRHNGISIAPLVLISINAAAWALPQQPPGNIAPPTINFKDITAEAGIDFVHVNGAAGGKLLPETMGGGCAFLDYDNDNDPDILLINSCPWPDASNSTPAHAPAPTHALYRNEGAGRFTNVTKGSGLDVSFYGMGAAVGDYDSDGFVDVFITAVGPNHLFHNNGDGTFTDVTAAAGVSGDADAWSTSAGFFDYNNDGDLDLFVCNFVKWSREIDRAIANAPTAGRAYASADKFEGSHCSLYANSGDGTFADVSEWTRVHINAAEGPRTAKALAVSIVDVDRDGKLDVFVANNSAPPFFLHNTDGASFEEKAAECGIVVDRDGKIAAFTGVDAAYCHSGKTLAFAVGALAGEMSSLFVAGDNALQFTDAAAAKGIGKSAQRNTFGVLFLDADLDGWLDLLHVNGGIDEHQPNVPYRQSAQLFWNAQPDAGQRFMEISAERVGDLARPIVGRGAAYADIDGDGDLDVLLTQVGGPPVLLRNDQTSAHHWLRVKLKGNGTTVHRDAIGARVELTAGGITQSRQVMPTRGYLSQVELPITFGLGQAKSIESMRVIWPDGSAKTVHDATAGRMIVVEQSQ